MFNNKLIIFCLIVLITNSRAILSADISIIGSLQGYISTDFNSESFYDKFRPYEVFNSKKGQIGLNSAILGSDIKGKDYYGTISLQFGDYSHGFRNNNIIDIQEAFIGYKINKNIAIEAGYFLSQKGQQLFKDDANQISFNPWYVYNFPLNLAGIIVKYSPSKEYEFSIAAYNSIYDRDSRTGNLAYNPSIKYKNDFSRISVTGYYGNEMFDNYKIFQMYNLFTTDFDITNSLSVGAEYMYNSFAGLPLRRALARNMSNFSIYASYKIFEDFTISSKFSRLWNKDSLWNMPENISHDVVMALEYKPSSKSYLRLEMRDLLLEGKRKNEYFVNDGKSVNYRTDVAIVFGFSFDRLIMENKSSSEN